MTDQVGKQYRRTIVIEPDELEDSESITQLVRSLHAEESRREERARKQRGLPTDCQEPSTAKEDVGRIVTDRNGNRAWKWTNDVTDSVTGVVRQLCGDDIKLEEDDETNRNNSTDDE